MQRISTSTRATDLFGAGKHGFKDGNQALGIAPTDFNADWCNQIQEEIANAIEASGAGLNAGDRAQLVDAIKKLPLGTGFLAANGWLQVPVVIGGLVNKAILQWGRASIASGQSAADVIFPVAFPTACLGIASADNATSSSSIQSQGVDLVTTTGFRVWTSNTNGDNPYWLAIGH